jgi:hypothetical protein
MAMLSPGTLQGLDTSFWVCPPTTFLQEESLSWTPISALSPQSPLPKISICFWPPAHLRFCASMRNLCVTLHKGAGRSLSVSDSCCLSASACVFSVWNPTPIRRLVNNSLSLHPAQVHSFLIYRVGFQHSTNLGALPHLPFTTIN